MLEFNLFRLLLLLGVSRSDSAGRGRGRSDEGKSGSQVAADQGIPEGLSCRKSIH